MPTVYAHSHIAGSVSNSANALGAPDGVFTTDTGNTNWTSRWAMQNPSLNGGSLSGTQTVTVTCRRGEDGGNDPSLAVNLYENGTLVQTLVADTAITVDGTTTVQGTFDASAVTDPDNVEVEIVASGSGGPVASRRSPQVDAMEWEVASVQPALEEEQLEAFTSTSEVSFTRLATLGRSYNHSSTSSSSMFTTYIPPAIIRGPQFSDGAQFSQDDIESTNAPIEVGVSSTSSVSFFAAVIPAYTDLGGPQFSNAEQFGSGEASPVPDASVLSAAPYTHTESCVLSVAGAVSGYEVRWSPSPSTPTAPGSIALTVVSDDLDEAGLGTVTVTAHRGIVRYGDTGYLWLVSSLGQGALGVPLLVEGAKELVVLTEPLVDPELRLTAIPDLEPGDQVIWWNVAPSGDAVVYPDGSFSVSSDVQSFDVEAHVANVGYTDTATQSFTEAFELFLNFESTHSSDVLLGFTGEKDWDYESSSASEVALEVGKGHSVESTSTPILGVTVTKYLDAVSTSSQELTRPASLTVARDFVSLNPLILDRTFTQNDPFFAEIDVTIEGVSGLELSKTVSRNIAVNSTHSSDGLRTYTLDMFQEFTATHAVSTARIVIGSSPVVISATLKHNTPGTIFGDNFGT